MSQVFAAAGLAGPLSVSDVTSRVKAALESSFPFCWVEGEISELTRPASGHCYLTLTDDASQLSCVMFRMQARQLRFQPQRGMKVLVYGNVSVYERGGRYQFYIYRMQPSGVGEFAVALAQLRARLEAEGLFDLERKRPLPPYPRAVGVVTSPTGAAIRDIVQVLGRRAPGLPVILAATPVQGDAAPTGIVRAIEALNRFGGVDVLVVGRGGGSSEDLWPFNDEAVVRAIYRSRIPVVAAVGHEIDHTLADHAADVRAPTPSAAAALVVQEHVVLRDRVRTLRRRLLDAVERHLDRLEESLATHEPARLLTRLRDRVDQQAQAVDEAVQRLGTALDEDLGVHRERLGRAVLRLEARNPLANLARGFTWCEDAEGRPVHAVDTLTPGDLVRLRFARGEASCRVEETLP